MMQILVFNCGSSSLKFELLDLDPSHGRRTTIARGEFENIGARTRFSMKLGNDREEQSPVPAHDHAAAALDGLDRIEAALGGSRLRPDAVVHRIVHGGSLHEPAIVDDAIMRALEDASEFAPLHNPPAIAVIRALRSRLDAPAVVVTDTGFHQELPEHALTYAIPRELTSQWKIRRYGFHGIAHAYMAERYAVLSGKPLGEANLVTLQLGAGCSAAAIRGGHSIDTSMGLTPLEGLMMGTRSGDLDPAIFGYLARKEGLAPSQVEQILNEKSGLLGVSGVSADMRELEAAAQKGDPAAALAIEMFCYRVRKYIGAYLAVLGSADAIVFGGGIGEHSASIRAKVCGGLESFGVELDAPANAACREEGCISRESSKVAIYVIALDEELYMARAAAALVKAGAGESAGS